MIDFLQQLVEGLSAGAIYAGLALALVLIYRFTGIVNFAQGELAMFSAFLAWQLSQIMPFWAALPLTLVLSFAGGMLIERVVIRPVEGAPEITLVIVTVGLFSPSTPPRAGSGPIRPSRSRIPSQRGLYVVAA